MKTLASILLSLLLPLSAFAATETVNGITWTYTVSDGSSSVGSGWSSAVPTSTQGAISIPATLGNCPVTSIGDRAFLKCSGLTSIVIPDSVTSIGSSAFSYCYGLTSIVIPDSVTSIGDYAFSGCSGLTSIVIPDGVTSIGYSAFSGCSGLTETRINISDIASWATNSINSKLIGTRRLFVDGGEITTFVIPDDVTSIGDYAFYGCSGLTSITIGNGVTSIGCGAFEGCSGLASIVIPDGVTSIGNRAFSGCSGLTSIVIPDGVTSIGDYAFSGCSGLTSIVIPDGVTSIGSYAFSGCSGLAETRINISDIASWATNSINSKLIGTRRLFVDGGEITTFVIPDGVTSIEHEAFEGCSGLTSITIGNGVTSIGYGAFEGCSGLTSITIGNGVTSIGYGAFEGCSGLASIVIPDGVTSIEHSAFSSCSGLTSIVIPDSVTSIGGYAFGRCSGLRSIVIPDGVTSIGGEAFEGCSGLTSIVIPDSVTSIGHYAFCGCSGLASIVIPDGVTSIEHSAFSSCSGLTSIVIPDSVTSIGNRAFYGCSGLTSITIGNGVTWIGEDAFSGCSGLTSIVIPDGVTSIGREAFSYCSELTSITIPNSVTSIGYYAFEGCSGLTSITIGNGVTWIGDGAFSGCSGLTSIVIPDGVTSIGYRTFSGCSGLTSIVIPDGVTSIRDEAFSGCSGLTSITIGNGVTSIRDGAFSGCSGLTSIVIPDGVTSIGNSAFRKCDNLFDTTSWPGLKLVDGWVTGTNGIPVLSGALDLTGVRGIVGGAFSGCSGLTSIVIPDGVTSIGDEAFSGCSGLTSIVIPDGVTSIGYAAFYGCSGLTSIVIPDGVTSIGYRAFSGCSAIRSVVVPGTTSLKSTFSSAYSSITNAILTPRSTEVASGTFTGASGVRKVQVPLGVTNIAYRAFSDCSALEEIWLPESFEGKTGNLGIRSGCTIRFHRPQPDGGCRAAGGAAVAFSAPASLPWTEWADASLPDGACLRSGAIGTNESSRLFAALPGSGRLAFRWKISAGRGDYCRFYVDGELVKTIQRSTAWSAVEFDFVGPHFLEWVFERGTGSAAGSDAAFLDDVDWRPDLVLTVKSAWGTPDPTRGRHDLVYGDSVAAAVEAPEASDGVRRVCTGWTGTGSVPASGTGTAVSFTITNDSSLVWNWRTDYQMALAVEGPVTADFADGWIAEGKTKIVNWSASVPYYSVNISGTTAGATLDRSSRTLSLPADCARSVTLSVTENVIDFSAEGPVTTDFAEAWGTGTNAPIVVHWTPTVPYYHVQLKGDSNGVSLDTNARTLSLPADRARSVTLAVTEHVIDFSAEGPVTTDFAEAWGTGTNAPIVVHWTPTVPYYHVRLKGDSSGVSLDTNARTITIPTTRSRALSLHLEEFTLADALDAEMLSWTTDEAAPWFPQVGTSADGDDAAQASPVAGDGASGLETTLEGAGTLSWTWRLSPGDNTGVDVFLDGEWLDAYAPGTDWSEASLDVAGAGMHTVRFEFWNAGSTADATAWIDQVDWTGDAPFGGRLRFVSATQTEAVLSTTTFTGGDPTPVSRVLEIAADEAFATVERNIVLAVVTEKTVEEVRVAGLAPETDYWARLRLSQGGETWTSDAVPFATAAHTPPALGTPVAEARTVVATISVPVTALGSDGGAVEVSVSATVSNTGEAAGTAAPATLAAPGAAVLDLKGLSPETSYRFVVTARAVATGHATTVSSGFTTKWAEAPLIAPGGSGSGERPALCFLPSESGTGEDFVIRIDNPVPGLWYPVYTNWTPSGPFAVQSCGMPESADGGYIVRVPAIESALFVKIGVSRTYLEPGRIEGEDPVAMSLNCPGMSFSTGGNAEWFVQEDDSHAGGSALRSGAISHSQNTWLETTVEGPGTLSFWWKVSSESVSYDYVEVLVDGTQKAKIGGTGGNWTRVELSIEGDGTHTVRWNYHKDSSDSSGSDCAWLDAVAWAPPRGSYTIRFLPNGGSGTMADQSAPLDHTVSLSRNGFSRDGFVFAGWSDSPTGDALYSNGAEVMNLANDPGGVATLYALWRERGGAAGLAIAYYDTSSSSFSTYSAMTSFFSSRTPTLEASTIDFGDTLDSAITGMSSYDVSRISNTGFRSFYSTTSASSGRLHGKYANGSQNSFCAHASGTIYLATAGTYSFGLAGDDGAVLYIDGTKVCSASWGSEGTGTIALTAGDHDLDLAFYEGSGGQGFLVQWKRPGDSVWSPLPQSVLSH